MRVLIVVWSAKIRNSKTEKATDTVQAAHGSTVLESELASTKCIRRSMARHRLLIGIDVTHEVDGKGSLTHPTKKVIRKKKYIQILK